MCERKWKRKKFDRNDLKIWKDEFDFEEKVNEIDVLYTYSKSALIRAPIQAVNIGM